MPEWTVDVPDELTVDLRLAMLLVDVAEQKEQAPQDTLILTLDRIGALKVEIFSNEHPPPHFRVWAAGESNNFTISDCRPMNGKALCRFFDKIREWHQKHKPELINVWNESRPSDCPVGQFRQ